MKSLAAEGKYEEAVEIVDSINWRKIKNINALVKAGEIYEQVGRYDDSREVLLTAYDRSPIGRMIIYRLAEVAIKTGNFEEAKDYYEEFVEIAPHDNLKYVLKYKINKAQGCRLQCPDRNFRGVKRPRVFGGMVLRAGFFIPQSRDG